MDYKMVLVDLDDTLLDSKQNITEKTVETINQLVKMGVKIVIATGRMYCSALPYIRKLNLSGEMICYNGAYIRDVESGSVICHQPIDLAFAEDIISETEKADLFLNLYLDDELYVSERNEKSELYREISSIEPKPVGKLSEFITKAPTKLLIIEKDKEKLQKYLSYFKDKYRSVLEITQSKLFFIEFMDKAVSKGNALKILSERHGISLDEVIAIGDSYNDIPMIKTAGTGIAVGNAPLDVKKEADLIAGNHDKEGVSTILAEIFNL